MNADLFTKGLYSVAPLAAGIASLVAAYASLEIQIKAIDLRVTVNEQSMKQHIEANNELLKEIRQDIKELRNAKR